MNLTSLRSPTALLALALFATSAGAWTGRSVEGSGISRTETRAVSGFTSVGISVPGDTEVTQGTSETLSITADDNLLAEIETVVENNALKIRFREKNLNVRTRTKMKIVLGVKELQGLSIAGSGDVKAGPLKSESLNVSISGSGDALFERLEAKSVKVSIAGSGDVTAAGKVDALVISIAGSGDVKAAKLETKTVAASIAGSGDATVWASESLKVRVAGSGDVKYYGNPSIDKSVVGSGRAKHLGAAPG
ncbi:head GIN domain-containing protein [Usitatibacter palustris]|uniref:Putative auto-transporter adhesin head GIN domain-containing protein n=1 Tax=Usitatibacter palustris TaxID=2732487 RepID=A0A6M4H7A7_9PROT|nr:head GIN domain-containing protein [Usitatibacter palustris]QJR15519.1 hypothetical protein DSM104440_02340 [Usitatibacter palustris]